MRMAQTSLFPVECSNPLSSPAETPHGPRCFWEALATLLLPAPLLAQAEAHLRGVGIIVLSSVRPEAPAGVGLGVQVASAEGLSNPGLPFRQVPEVRRLHQRHGQKRPKITVGTGLKGARISPTPGLWALSTHLRAGTQVDSPR